MSGNGGVYTTRQALLMRTKQKAALKAIYFGPEIDRQSLEILCLILNGQNSGVEFWQGREDHTGFKIEFGKKLPAISLMRKPRGLVFLTSYYLIVIDRTPGRYSTLMHDGPVGTPSHPRLLFLLALAFHALQCIDHFRILATPPTPNPPPSPCSASRRWAWRLSLGGRRELPDSLHQPITTNPGLTSSGTWTEW